MILLLVPVVATSDCCIFQPAFGCCTLQTQVKICFFTFLAWKHKKEQKRNKKGTKKEQKEIKWGKTCVFWACTQMLGWILKEPVLNLSVLHLLVFLNKFDKEVTILGIKHSTSVLVKTLNTAKKVIFFIVTYHS